MPRLTGLKEKSKFILDKKTNGKVAVELDQLDMKFTYYNYYCFELGVDI